MIRVLLVDDHRWSGPGWPACSAARPISRVVGQATDGRQAVALALSHSPDVVLMDLSMPVLDGIEATRADPRRAPARRIVALTSFADEDTGARRARAGAVGYLLKDTDPRRFSPTAPPPGPRAARPAGRGRPATDTGRRARRRPPPS